MSEDTGKFSTYKEQVGAVSHFLGLNGLDALVFKMPKDQFRKHLCAKEKLIPIALRDYGRSSTTVFVETFDYDHDTETLTIRAKDVLKYVQ